MWSPRTRNDRSEKKSRSRGKDRGGRADRRRRDESLVEMATVEELLDALERVDLERPWPHIGESLLPVLQRRRALPPGGDSPLKKRYPPG
ncbi:MAG: hypothetical protein M3406_01415, partial [Chloroflexota bacterium]|nr:hypothetical protein [Chloroflexota bacterium]